jgi:hypothetical protein
VKVLDGEDVANHADLESCVVHREVGGEALTEVRAGQVLSRESTITSGCRRFPKCGRQHARAHHASARAILRGRRPWHVRKSLAREPGDLWVGHRRVVRVGEASEP